jgi:hypothetical protein
MIATIKEMFQSIEDCVRINIMVGEQGITHEVPYWDFKYSSYTDIKVHLILYAFNILINLGWAHFRVG